MRTLLFLVFLGALSISAPPATAQSPSLTTLEVIDLDGDGRLDRLVGEPIGYRRYRNLQAVLADGRTLTLPFLPGGIPDVEHLRIINMPGAVIVTTRETGGSVGSLVEAFACDPSSRQMVRLNWNDQPSELTTEGETLWDPDLNAAVVPRHIHDEVRHLLFSAYRYRQGRLERVKTWYGAHGAQIPYPRERWAVITAMLNAIGLRQAEEFRRYFADQRLASRLYQGWVDRIPEGMTFYLDERYQAGVDDRFILWGNEYSSDGRKFDRKLKLQGVGAFAYLEGREVLTRLWLREIEP